MEKSQSMSTWLSAHWNEKPSPRKKQKVTLFRIEALLELMQWVLSATETGTQRTELLISWTREKLDKFVLTGCPEMTIREPDTRVLLRTERWRSDIFLFLVLRRTKSWSKAKFVQRVTVEAPMLFFISSIQIQPHTKQTKCLQVNTSCWKVNRLHYVLFLEGLLVLGVRLNLLQFIFDVPCWDDSHSLLLTRSRKRNPLTYFRHSVCFLEMDYGGD